MSQSSERLLEELHRVVAEAETLLRATADQAGEGTSELRSRVQATLDGARRSLTEVQHAAVDKARAAGRATDQYVHEKPWHAIGLAAGVGLLVGMLISRR
ncbi:YqjD family protein [Roseateles sp. BYS180W]|uniref:YqjD family protein n=1 Tax=Roseateles rivi TaxID=3299028 RepID=A0ABW7FR47_9BURK